MPLLFDRTVAITLDDLRVTGLRMAFKITHSAKPEANPAEISIWNLNFDHRAKVQGQPRRPISVLVEAGYGKNLQTIFRGNLRRAPSSRQGPDWVTTLRCGDGEHALATARISESFRPGKKIKDVMKRLAKKLQESGLDLGDTLSRLDSATHRQKLTEFLKGTVLDGPAKEHFDALLQAHGLEWSVQDNAIQVLPVGQPTNAEAVLLTPKTGLIGSPCPGEKGLIKFTALLQPSLRPGRQVKVESAQLNGFYRAEKVTHTGDTHGQPWYSEIEGRPL